LLEVRSLRFDYPNHPALVDVSFTLTAGSVTALVGPNGAGKSTLMRCIAGLAEPLSGAVYLNGVAISDNPRLAHRDIGYLEDEFGLYDELTASQCLRYAAAARGVPDAALDARTEAVAAQLDISHCLPKRVRELSRGQRQRVAIGQAIISAPKLLVLDEPASGLDPEARASLADLFKRLQADGITLLVSSHILTELEAYSTHMLVLRAGRMIEYRALATVAAGATPLRSERRKRSIDAVLQVPWPDWAALKMAGAQIRSLTPENADVADATHLQIEGEFDDAEQTAFLRQLINGGAQVLSFSETRQTLAASYEQSIADAPLTGTTDIRNAQ
jgi:ABC-2 type transport system ATP-binding protein